jgi:hypothetical protein
MLQSNSPLSPRFASHFAIYERVEMTMFSIQEFIISGLYIYETRKLLKPGAVFRKKRSREVMRHLIYVNVLIVCLDITLLALEYANLFMIQGVYKAMVYGIKLRLEFSILNQLLKIAQGNKASFSTDPGSMYGSSEAAVKGLESASRGYSVSAATNQSSANQSNADGTVKTGSAKDNKGSVGDVQQAPPTARVERGSRSSASSEVEFMGESY